MSSRLNFSTKSLNSHPECTHHKHGAQQQLGQDTGSVALNTQMPAPPYSLRGLPIQKLRGRERMVDKNSAWKALRVHHQRSLLGVGESLLQNPDAPCMICELTQPITHLPRITFSPENCPKESKYAIHGASR